MHHFAFDHDSFDDLMVSYARLRAIGLMPEVCLDHEVTTSLYYADLDDNLVEPQADNFENWNASTDWMRTAPAFAENPVGDFFDAEAICQDHLDGKPSDQIRTGISNGAYAPTKAPNLRLPAP